jgi:6-phosphofructokinase 1
VDYIDRSFGFLTAVEAAQASIRTAKVESMCTMPNGVTVVKLMGRSAGFLAATSALGSGDVDAVLVPEVPIVLDGPNGILPFIYKRTKEQKYAVVVVAEGGEFFMCCVVMSPSTHTSEGTVLPVSHTSLTHFEKTAGEEILGRSTEVDKGGNRKLPAIGEYIRDQIKDYFAAQGEESVVRYIDPSYTVRSVPANAADTIYCMDLAVNAVHGTMCGYSKLKQNFILYAQTAKFCRSLFLNRLFVLCHGHH